MVPALLNKMATANKIPKAEITNLDLPAKASFRPSRLRYLTRESIKKESAKTKSKKIIGIDCGRGERSFPFLYIKTKEANTPPLTVVGRP